MLCKINDKYYVKVANFYQELQLVNDNIVPIQGEKNRLYAPVSNCEVVSTEEVYKKLKKKKDKSKKNYNIDF